MARPTTEELSERQNLMQTIADCADSPSKFSEIFLDHKLFEYNKKYVDCKDRFIVYRSGRQVGKTMSTAVKCIHFAFFAPLMLGDLGFTLICLAYFAGGITIGYYIPKWRKSRKPRGDGRWD